MRTAEAGADLTPGVAFPPLSELASERMLERRTVCTHGDGRSLAEHLRWASYRTDQEARRASPWPTRAHQLCAAAPIERAIYGGADLGGERQMELT
jgi:hypothetical protein